ncbi:MAG: ATP-binding protein [Brevundimonas sp.]|nr:ATP-binding protein [Brevundimonas sp.]
MHESFLTIGTRSRLDQPSERYVGGKGIGRLSAMRLADRMTVVTSRAGETYWNTLDIDWRLFTHGVSKRLEDVRLEPEIGDQKFAPDEHGTTINLRGLKADWSWERVDRLARLELDRLFDPFSNTARYPVLISVNGRPVTIPSFDRALLSEAQARAQANYYLDDEGQPHFVFQIEYLAYGRSKTIHWDQSDMIGITSKEDISVAAMRSLGPFTAHLHWFNRQKLKAIEGVGTRAVVRDLVNSWANGLLMYRDGFRVNPYGAADDDWLGIDFKALGSSGYKVNRKQLIGAVNISASGNPQLIDQTNREGLRSNEERRLLILLLQKAVTEELRNFFNAVDREIKKTTRLDVKDTTAFLESVGARTKRTLGAIRIRTVSTEPARRLAG